MSTTAEVLRDNGVTVVASHMQEVGQSGPTGLALTAVLLVAVAFLVRSMSKHLRRIPSTFEPVDPREQVPETPAQLLEPRPGEELLNILRKAPLAIEPPRDDWPDSPGPRG